MYTTHQATVSRTCWKVTQAIIQCYGQITFTTSKERSDAWFDYCGLPNIQAAVDCTHVPIRAPNKDQYPGNYFNRKNWYSVNVQLMCDLNTRILDCVPDWPGSVHDSRIIKNCTVYNDFMSGRLKGVKLGDGGYGATTFLATPVKNPLTPEEQRYNRQHARGRAVIERTNGILKRRFFCLGSQLRIAIDRVPSTIYACCILHNKALDFKEADATDRAVRTR